MLREHNGMAVFGNQLAEHEVVGAVAAQHAKAADLLNALAAHGHGGAQQKLHALKHVGDHDAGGHLNRHARRLKVRPQAAMSLAAINAGERAHALIAEGRGDGAQIARLHMHVAVADNQQIVLRGRAHQFQRGYFGVDVLRLAGAEKTRRNMRMARGHAAGNLHAGVVGAARAEENLVVGVVLPEEAVEVRFEARLLAVQWLEQAQRRKKLFGPLVRLLIAEAERARDDQHRKDGGGDQPHDGDEQQQPRQQAAGRGQHPEAVEAYLCIHQALGHRDNVHCGQSLALAPAVRNHHRAFQRHNGSGLRAVLRKALLHVRQHL